MGWAFNVPFGSVRDFTAVVSPLGFEIQFNGWVLDNLSLGVSGEWATYVDNRPRTTVTVDQSAITATAYNYMQTTSAHFLVHYFFPGGGPVRPYIGPHAGVSWTMFDLEAADLALSDSEFSFNFGGEAGVEIPFGHNAPVALANLRYSFAPAAEFRNIVTNVQSFGLLLGIGF
jgi:outer membrane protein W